MDADGGKADEDEGDGQVAGKWGEREADGTDEERAEYVPDFIPGDRRGLADDQLYDECRHHRNGDGAAEQRVRKAGKFFENGRHPEVEAPETDDPEEINQAEFQNFRVAKCLEDGILFHTLHGCAFFFVIFREAGLFFGGEPADLVGAILYKEEEKSGKG